MFKIIGFENNHSEPFDWIGVTADEVFVKGEVMQLTSDLLALADLDSDGVQLFVTQSGGTGVTGTKVACTRIQRQQKYHIDADNVAAGTYVLGTAYELNAAGDGITNTATKGVFVVDENVTADDSVIGHFETLYDI